MFENISKELLKKAMKAKTKDEALAILKEGGVELTDEDLQNISAGEEGDEGICWTHVMPCSFLCPQKGKKCIEYCGYDCKNDWCWEL